MAALIPSIANLIATISKATLNPIVAGTGLAALRYGPEHVSLPLLKEVSLSGARRDRVRAVLKVLLALAIARSIHRALNAIANNHWRVWTQKSAWNWHNEIAVITGGSSGIGKATALGLVKRGVRVAVLDLQELPQDMERDSNIHYFKCDITSAAAVAETAAAIRLKLGQPSILINNAGMANYKSILASTHETVKKLLAVNLQAHFTTTREFLPSMVAQNKGHIVAIASMASFITLPASADYCASKAGAQAFHECLGWEIRRMYKAPGVVTSVVHPSWVNTNIIGPALSRIEQARGSVLRPEAIADKIVSQILSCRGGQIIVPDYLSVLSGLRGWPTWMQEALRELGAKQI
jgi:all-trans-retinol dehydrogenase (NAD+)